MTTLRPRYAKIERVVAQLLEENDIRQPAVDVVAIAESKGAEIHLESFEKEVSGVLIRQKDRIIIGVEKTQSVLRQRFTIAHEIGHLLLHQSEDLHVDRSFSVNWRRMRDGKDDTEIEIKEVEANAFAASLLMPQKMIETAHGSQYFDLEEETEISRLAELFKVSTQAMNFRLFNLFGRTRYRPFRD